MDKRRRSAVSSRRRDLANSPTPQLLSGYVDMACPIVCLEPKAGSRAIEDDSFPFEVLSEIAEIESWRKEINRPITHIHF